MSDVISDMKKFTTRAVKATAGFDTSSIVSKANSDPKIEAFAKRDEDDLDNLYIKKVEYSLTKENTLSSIKFIYADGK